MPTIYSLLKDNKKHKILYIKKVEDFFKLSFRLMENENYIYRGINIDDQKYPKIIRLKDCSKYEAGLLQEFEKYYGLYFNSSNFWEFIALAQHHGLKTRLIDFTYNIFVAAFFALHKKAKNGMYKIFVFNKQNFQSFKDWNRDITYVSEPDDRMSDDVVTAFNIFKDRNVDFILNPHYSNNRMFVQQGLFVVPSVLTKKHVDKLYDDASIEIIISANVRKYILERINNFGYNEYRLMPDLDSACHEINDFYNA